MPMPSPLSSLPPLPTPSSRPQLRYSAEEYGHEDELTRLERARAEGGRKGGGRQQAAAYEAWKKKQQLIGADGKKTTRNIVVETTAGRRVGKKKAPQGPSKKDLANMSEKDKSALLDKLLREYQAGGNPQVPIELLGLSSRNDGKGKGGKGKGSASRR